MKDVLVRTAADFDRLPDEGLWEVADGRAILLASNDIPHQRVSGRLSLALSRGLKAAGSGHVYSTVNVKVPPRDPVWGEVQNRVPDLVVSHHEPEKLFEVGDPPELVIEILSTRRGNVERTEKLDDYSRAGIGEYWIVNPSDRAVEIHILENGDYVLRETATVVLEPTAFPGLRIDLREVWAVLA